MPVESSRPVGWRPAPSARRSLPDAEPTSGRRSRRPARIAAKSGSRRPSGFRARTYSPEETPMPRFIAADKTPFSGNFNHSILDFGFWILDLRGSERGRGSRDRRVRPRGGGAEQSDETEGGGGAGAPRRGGAAGREHAPAIRSEGAGSGWRCGNRSEENARNPRTSKPWSTRNALLRIARAAAAACSTSNGLFLSQSAYRRRRRPRLFGARESTRSSSRASEGRLGSRRN